jgi:hypothetical protein
MIDVGTNNKDLLNNDLCEHSLPLLHLLVSTCTLCYSFYSHAQVSSLLPKNF